MPLQSEETTKYVEYLLECPEVKNECKLAFSALIKNYMRDLDEHDYAILIAVKAKNKWALESMFLTNISQSLGYASYYAMNPVWFLDFLRRRPDILDARDSTNNSILYNLCSVNLDEFPKEIFDHVIQSRPELLCGHEGDGTSLHEAVTSWDIKTSQYLLDNGVDYDIQLRYSGCRVLMYSRNQEMIFLLFDYGLRHQLDDVHTKHGNALEYTMVNFRKRDTLVARTFYALGLRTREPIPDFEIPDEDYCAKIRYRAYFQLPLAKRLLVHLNHVERRRSHQASARIH